MLDNASRLLEIDAKWLQPFDVTDPFHDGLRLEGFLCLKPNQLYGALALMRVGEEDAPQKIYATPKLHYPFGKDGVFRFPPIRSVRIYEKLDGTNVLAYQYRDAAGTARTTYKLRLHPVLRNSRWGEFLEMWRELIALYPEIADVSARNDCAISFEMYGSRNAHLIAYDDPLRCAALFGVRSDGTPVAPCDLDLGSVPAPELLLRLNAGEDPVAAWAALRDRMEAGNKPVDEERLSGTEGAVWYVADHRDETVLFKCKPESVEAVHWKVGISKRSVMATCWNLFESHDVLDYETLLPLLQEEYEDDDIDRFRAHIDECIEFVNEQLEFRDSVLSVYREASLSFHGDRGTCMRTLSQHFPRARMREVFGALTRELGASEST